MKNRAVRALLCGMFCVVISGATIAKVSAAPTAGIISVMAGRPASVQTTAAKETSKGTADAPALTETETAATPTAGATSGVFASLAPSTETPAAESPAAEAPVAETPAAETPALETPAGTTAAPAAETPVAETPAMETPAETTAAPAAETPATTPASTPTTSSGVMQAMANILSETEAVPQQESAAEESTGTDGAASETPAGEEAGEGAEGETPAETGTAAGDKEAEQYADIGIATVTDFVNVRSEANADSEAVGKLYANNALKVLETTEDGQWYHIKSGDVDGFVSADYVSVGDEDLIKQASNRTATVHTETLFVRALPSQDSDIIGMVPDGEDLTVTDETYVDTWGWVGVSIEEGSGYVSMEFVDLDNRYTYGETKEAEEARLAREEEERRAAAAAAQETQAKSQKSSSSSSSSGSSGGGSYAAAGGGSGGSVANYALQFVGNPYVYGGSSLTNGTDCSGFVMSVYANYGVGLPHSSSAMRGVGYGVDPSQMQAGDIVCYSGHVGICIGGGQIVHASTPATGIKVSSAYYRDILAVRRIF